MYACVWACFCFCVCVCLSEGERKGDSKRDKEIMCVFVCVCVLTPLTERRGRKRQQFPIFAREQAQRRHSSRAAEIVKSFGSPK